MAPKGFTLIELLVVIAIIGILSSVVLASLNTARERGLLAAGKEFDANVYHAIGDSLVSEWRFDECSGLTTGDSAGAHTATLAGTISWLTSNTPFGTGCAVQITGPGYVSLGTLNSFFTGNQDYTLSAWFKAASAPGAGSDVGIVWYGGTSVRNVACLCMKGNALESLHYGDDAVFSYEPSLNTWHHAVIVYSAANNQSTLYVDGALKQTLTHSGTLNLSSKALAIGADTAGGRVFSGSIDAVRIYMGAYGLSRIQEIYAEEAPSYGIAVR